MIEPLRYDSGKIATLQTASNMSCKKFDLLVFQTSGYATRASEDASEVRFMALEDISATGSTAGGDVKVLYLDGVECEASTDATMGSSNVGTYLDVKNASTLDLESNQSVFFCTKMVGSTADQTCRGYFVMKTS